MHTIQRPYLLFLGDSPDMLSAKVARGIAEWRPDFCVGQIRLADCKADLGIRDLTLEAARDLGAKTLVVGVANRGGIINETWIDTLVEALDLGFDVAAGLHNRLSEVATVSAAAAKNARKLFDVRHPTMEFPIANGKPRSGNRLLTVGTDCSVGKMYTALAIEKEMSSRGMDVDFRATGQTGILISGSGVSIDAVVSDFVAGAVETISPDNQADHWDVIEGQGSLFHASYAGVSLGLLHGSQADALLMCHEPTRTHIRGLEDYALPDMSDCLQMNLAAARLTNPKARFVGFSVNTSQMQQAVADDFLQGLEDRFELPAVDPLKHGVSKLVDKAIEGPGTPPDLTGRGND